MNTTSQNRPRIVSNDQMLVTFSQVNQAILRLREDKPRLLLRACAIIREGLAYRFVWIGELDRAQQLITSADSGLPDEAKTDGETPLWLTNMVRQAVDSGAALLVEQVTLEDPSGPPAVHEVAVVPSAITDHGTLVMAVAASGDHSYEREESDLLQEMAGDLAFAITTMAVADRTRQAEEALRISEDRFRRLAEHSLVGIVLIQNDLYRYVNPAFARMFGYDAPREIIDRFGPVDLAAPESRDIVDQNVRRQVLGQVRSSRYQYRGLRKDGAVFDVEEHGARTVHAKRLAIVATVLDITSREASRKRLEALSIAGLALSSAQTPQEVLDKAVEQAVRILPGDVASVVLFDGPRPRVAACGYAGDEPCAPPTVETIVRRSIEAAEPWPLEPMMGHESIVINTDALPNSHKSASQRPVRALVAAPSHRTWRDDWHAQR